MTLLQVYLDSISQTSLRLPLGDLSPQLFRQATNSVKCSVDNNDLLEFVGDRAVNLVAALLVEKEKVCPDQQIFVGRKVSCNDTLGRIAWWMHLDKYAALSSLDADAIRNWSPRRKRDPPPKVLANLFEAFVGAYWLELGWSALLSWLEPFLNPLVQIATEDFLLCHRNTCHAPFYVSNWWRQQNGDSINQGSYQQLVQYLAQQQSSLTSMGRVAVEAIPLSTKLIYASNGELVSDCDRVEVAHHLISQWICNIYVTTFPEIRNATSRAAHLASTITNFVTSDLALAFLASFFSLSSYFDVEDADFNSTRPVRWALPRDPAASAREATYRTKLSLAFQAAVGWFYHCDPRAAQAWGIQFFTPIVTEAYHILIQKACYQPVLPLKPQARRPLRSVSNLPRSVHLDQRPTPWCCP